MFVNEELRGIINMRKEKKYKTSWEGGLAWRRETRSAYNIRWKTLMEEIGWSARHGCEFDWIASGQGLMAGLCVIAMKTRVPYYENKRTN
jgi:hypothetical protein